MQRSRHQFLARSGFSRDQNRLKVWGDVSDFREGLQHQRTTADHPLKLEDIH
jgi:hypothetical protein